MENLDEKTEKFQPFEKQKGQAERAYLTRNSSFELLRIIAMLMIIGHHFVVHGGFLDASTVNSWILTFLEFGGKFGVIIYLLISGYFMVTSKFTFRKLLKLWCQVWFYSVLLYVLSIFLPNFHFSARGLVTALFPVLMVEWWFVTYYIFLYLLSPFINKLAKVLSRSEYGWLIVLLLFLYNVYNNLSNRRILEIASY